MPSWVTKFVGQKRVALMLGMVFLWMLTPSATSAQRVDDDDMEVQWQRLVDSRETLLALEVTEDNVKSIGLAIGRIRRASRELIPEIGRRRDMSQKIDIDVAAVYETVVVALERQLEVWEAASAGRLELTERRHFLVIPPESYFYWARKGTKTPREIDAVKRMLEVQWSLYEAYVAFREVRGWPIDARIYRGCLRDLNHLSPTGQAYGERAIQLIESWIAADPEADRIKLDREIAETLLETRWFYHGEGLSRCFTNVSVQAFTDWLVSHPSTTLRMLGEIRRLRGPDVAIRQAAALSVIDEMFPLAPRSDLIWLDPQDQWIETAVSYAMVALGKERTQSWFDERLDHVFAETDPRCFLVYPDATVALLYRQPVLSNISNPEWRRLSDPTREDLRLDAAGRIGSFSVMYVLLREYEIGEEWHASRDYLLKELEKEIKRIEAKKRILSGDQSPWTSGQLALKRVELKGAQKSWGTPVGAFYSADPAAPSQLTLLFSDRNTMPSKQRNAARRTMRWVMVRASLDGEAVEAVAEAQAEVNQGELVSGKNLAVTSDMSAILHGEQLTVMTRDGSFSFETQNQQGRRVDLDEVVTLGNDIYACGPSYVGRIDTQAKKLKDIAVSHRGNRINVEGLGLIRPQRFDVSSVTLADEQVLAMRIRYSLKSRGESQTSLVAYNPQRGSYRQIEPDGTATRVHDGKLYWKRGERIRVYDVTAPENWRKIESPWLGHVNTKGEPFDVTDGYKVGSYVLFRNEYGRTTASDGKGAVFPAAQDYGVDLDNATRLSDNLLVGFVEQGRPKWENPDSRSELFFIEAVDGGAAQDSKK